MQLRIGLRLISRDVILLSLVSLLLSGLRSLFLSSSRLLLFDYLLTNSLFYEFQRLAHPYRWKLSQHTYEVLEFDTFCGLGPHAKVDLAALNHAIATLRKRGELQAIMDRYRPPRQ